MSDCYIFEYQFKAKVLSSVLSLGRAQRRTKKAFFEMCERTPQYKNKVFLKQHGNLLQSTIKTLSPLA